VNHIDFLEVMLHAKENDDVAISMLFDMYKPLLIHLSIIDGLLDEDLRQELWIIFVLCIRSFKLYDTKSK